MGKSKLRWVGSGSLFEITEQPKSKYRSIDDPFDEDKAYFWVSLSNRTSRMFYIDNSSVLDIDKGLTKYVLLVEGKEEEEHEFWTNDYFKIAFKGDYFESSHGSINALDDIVEFLEKCPLITVNPGIYS